MTAIREQIFAEIEVRLRALSGVAEVERAASSDPISFPALQIYDGGHRLTEGQAGTSQYDLSVTIEGFIEAEGGSAAHAAINDLYARVVAALMPEPPLAGLAETIDERDLRVDVAPLASVKRLGFSVDFQIMFPTQRGDPAQPA